MLSSLYRLISALMGGAFGTLFMFLVYSASIFLLGNQENPITSFILIIMIFLGSLTANLMCGVLFGLSAPEKYTQQSSTLWHTFLINLFLFLVAFPFYILIAHTFFVAIVHIVLSAFASNIIFESFAEKGTYALTGLYASLFALFILAISFLLLQDTAFSTLFLFTVLPLVWFVFTMLSLCIEWAYTLFFQVFHVAVLDPKYKM